MRITATEFARLNVPDDPEAARWMLAMYYERLFEAQDRLAREQAQHAITQYLRFSNGSMIAVDPVPADPVRGDHARVASSRRDADQP